MAKTPEELNKGRKKRAVSNIQPEVRGMVPASIPFSFSPAGHAVLSDSIHRYVKRQYITADKYDLFLDNTQDLLFRRYSVCGYGFPELPSTFLSFFSRGVYNSRPGSHPGLPRAKAEPIIDGLIVEFTGEYGRYN